MKFLFYLLNEYSVPIVKPLIKHLEAEGKGDQYRLYLSPKVEKIAPAEWSAAHQLKTLSAARRFSPDFVISAENYLDYRMPGIKVQIFHGVGVEKPAHFKIRHFFDLYLTSGPYVTEPFKAAAQQLGYFQVLETGWPKFDHILNYQPGEESSGFKKTPGQKIILYAPTFSRRMQSAEVLAESIPNQMSAGETWLIKFHELMSPKLRAAFEAAEHDNLRIIRDSDITPWLHLADVMVSDTSSVVYEFSCLGKPVITFRTQGNPDKGLNIETAAELRPALDLLLQQPSFRQEERHKVLLSVNPYLDGKIAARVFNALERVHHAGFAPAKPKPWNLFRKAKVLLNTF
jgi:CDP-glycerol glycerophosphotransferase (TagB/SpsB family)